MREKVKGRPQLHWQRAQQLKHLSVFFSVHTLQHNKKKKDTKCTNLLLYCYFLFKNAAEARDSVAKSIAT